MVPLPVPAQEFIQYGSAVTYNDKTARASFPQSWGQYGNSQRHNPVYSVPANAPAFLTSGTLAAAPLTGDEFRRVDTARKYFPADGDMAWGASSGQWLGNVVGVSVTQGIVFATTSRRELYALDAQTALAVWRKELVGPGGMGQPLVQLIGTKLRVFVDAGDPDYNGENAVRAAYGYDSNRGAGYSAVYCFDALTGAQVWRYDTKGASRPTMLYRNGYLFAANGDGHLYVLNASTGALVSTFTNPGEGQVGMASPNWYQTPQGQVLIYYGTTSPRNILAVDVTNPAAPFLAWSYASPGASANSTGDVAMAVDPDAGLVVTSVFTNVGTSTAPVYDLRVLALNAANGQVVWSAFGGQGPTLDGFKAGNPMIDSGAVYLGNPLNATVQSYDLATGTQRWMTSVASSDPAVRIAPRAAPVLVNGKLLITAQRHVFTLDPATGALLNDFYNPYPYAAYGLNQPVVIGKQVYLSSVSGYVQYWPIDTVTTLSGPPTETVPTLPLKTAEYYDSRALPTSTQAALFPSTWLAYAGNPAHNSYLSTGPSITRWSKSLVYGLSLTGTPLDESIYGSEIAAQMTHYAFGVGSGVSPAKGMVYVAGDDRTVQAFNGVTGKLVWRFRTNNLNFGQPLVTANAVIVAGGNLGLNLGNYGSFIKQSAQTRVGTGFMYIHALDPNTGNEKWTFYAGQGAMSTTPLYFNGVLYWVDGQNKMWSISATTGQPVAPFMDVNGYPVLSLGGGFNAISSANLYQDTAGRNLMVVGLTMPNRLVAIDLATASVAWTQSLAGFFNHITGLGTTSVAVDQANGLVIGTTVVEADYVLNSARLLAFALNGTTGDIAWTQRLDAGPVPSGYVAATPMIANGRVFLANPIAQQTVALDVATGAPVWKTSVALTAGSRYSWAPGVWIPTTNRLLQPMGSELVAFDASTGAVLKRTAVGGAMTFNHPTVLGTALYIGNSYGWLLAYTLADVGG